MMLRSVAKACAIVLLVIPLAVANAHDTGTFGEPGDATKVTRVVAVAMNDMSFDPALLSVSTGETIRFVVTNKSTVDHEFALGDEKTQASHRQMMAAMMKNGVAMHHHDTNVVSVNAGQTRELIWHFTRPGQYEFDCNIPGHYEAGMKGTIAVAPKT